MKKQGTMRILYVGEIEPGRTAYQRMVALRDLGHEVTSINIVQSHRPTGGKWLWARVCMRAGFPPDACEINRKITEQFATQEYDVLWLDKVLTVRSKTLVRVKKSHPHCCCVFYTLDDMRNPWNRSWYYTRLLPEIDLYFTTKSFQVEELKSEGCREVVFVGNGFDPHTHKPYDLSDSERIRWGTDVGFIGGFEKDRYQQILMLAEQGIEVRTIGSFWEKVVERHPKIRISCGDVVGVNYAKAICATKINLCFLRKANRDLQTTRSIEIPACGGFMLAERTNEHLELFKEGKEAEFFGSDEELLDKVKYYLAYDEERKRMARAGRQRCLKSGYSNHSRLKKVIDKIVVLLQ